MKGFTCVWSTLNEDGDNLVWDATMGEVVRGVWYGVQWVVVKKGEKMGMRGMSGKDRKREGRRKM